MFTDFEITVAVMDANDTPTLVVGTVAVNESLQFGDAAMSLENMVEDEDTFTNQPWLLDRKPQTISYALVHDGALQPYVQQLASNIPFTVKGSDLIVNGTIDHETRPLLFIIVSATDNGSPPLTTSNGVLIQVGDEPEAPTHINLTHTHVNETIATSTTHVGTVIGDVVVYDEDIKDADVVVEILKGTNFSVGQTSCKVVTESDLFNTTGARNWMRCTAALDVAGWLVYTGHASSVREILISVTDNAGTHLTRFNITVMNINEPPTALFASTPSINENTKQQVLVSELYVVDADVEDSHRFEIVDESELSPFAIMGSEMFVQRSHLLDYENASVVNVSIKVIDSGAPQLSSTFVISIDVLDVNEAPIDITLHPNSIREDKAEIGTVVGHLHVVDPDDVYTLVQTHTCELFDASNTFGVDGDNNVVVLTNTIDFERVAVYKDMFLTCIDNGIPSLSLSQALSINVVGTNEHPNAITLSSHTVSENKPLGTIVGTLTTTDPDNDAGNTTSQLMFTYTITPTHNLVGGEEKDDDDTGDDDGDDDGGGLDSPPFAVTSDNVVVTTRVLDFETKSVYTFYINVTDNGGLSFAELFTVTVVDENDVPSAITPTTFNVIEGQQGVFVGVFSTKDDDKNQHHIYELIDTELNDGGDFRIQGDKLFLSESFAADFEQTPRLVVTVRVTDDGTPPRWSTQTIVVRVQNINEHPTSVALYNDDGDTVDTVPENLPVGSIIGVVVVTDPDNTRTLGGIVEDDDDDDIDDDDDDDDDEDDLVGDGNHGRGNVHQNHTCELVQWSDVRESTFELLSNLSLVVTNSPLDYETIGDAMITITMNCVDNGEPALNISSASLQFQLTNINERPTSIVVGGIDLHMSSVLSIQENLAVNTDITSFAVVDLDNCDKRWCFPHQHHSIFVNSSSTSASFVVIDGRLVSQLPLNFEEISQIDLAITVRDNGIPSLSSVFDLQVYVGDANDRPQVAYVGEKQFSPNDQAGHVLGRVVVFDDDDVDTANGRHSLSISTSPTQQEVMQLLEIVDSKLVVKSNRGSHSPPSPTPPLGTTYYVSIVVTDDGVPPLSSATDISITFEHRNQPLTLITTHPLIMSVFEMATVGDVVGTVVVVDPDNTNCSLPCKPQSHTCVIEITSCTLTNPKVRCPITSHGDDNDDDDVDGDGGGDDGGDGDDDDGDDGDDDTGGGDDGNGDGDDDSGGESVTNMTAPFVMVGMDVVVNATNTLDFETISEYFLSIICTDSGSPPFTLAANATIAVVDVNEAPHKFSFIGATEHGARVAEDAVDGFRVGSLVVVDEDIGQSHTFAIVGDADDDNVEDNGNDGDDDDDDGGDGDDDDDGDGDDDDDDYDDNDDGDGRFQQVPFIIDGNNLIVHRFPGVDLDFESHNQYHLKISVTATGTPPITITHNLVVFVDDVEEAPTAIVLRCGCRGHPCVNNGVCVQPQQPTTSTTPTTSTPFPLVYRCDCPEGFAGKECEVTPTKSKGVAPLSTGKQCLTLPPQVNQSLGVANVIVIDDDVGDVDTYTISLQSDRFGVRNNNEIFVLSMIDKYTPSSELVVHVVAVNDDGASIETYLNFSLSPCVIINTDTTTTTCDVNADCHTNGGVATCTCKSGYHGDGVSCVLLNRSVCTLYPCDNVTDVCIPLSRHLDLTTPPTTPPPTTPPPPPSPAPSRSDITPTTTSATIQLRSATPTSNTPPPPPKTTPPSPPPPPTATTTTTTPLQTPPRLCASITSSTIITLHDDGQCANVTTFTMGGCGNNNYNNNNNNNNNTAISMSDFKRLLLLSMSSSLSPSSSSSLSSVSDLDFYPIGFVRVGSRVEVRGVVVNTSTNQLISLPHIVNDLRRTCTHHSNNVWSICNLTFVQPYKSPATVAANTIHTTTSDVVDTAQSSPHSIVQASYIVTVVVVVLVVAALVAAYVRRQARKRDDYHTGRTSPKRLPISFTNPAYVSRTAETGVLYPTQQDVRANEIDALSPSRMGSTVSKDAGYLDVHDGTGSDDNSSTNNSNSSAKKNDKHNDNSSNNDNDDDNDADDDVEGENYIIVMGADGMSVKGTMRGPSSTRSSNGSSVEALTAVTISNPLFSKQT